MARDITGTATLSDSFAVPTNNLLRFRVPTAGTLVKLSVYSATAPSGDDAEFDLKVNGGSVGGVTLPDGGNDAFDTFSEAVVENDLIRVDLTSTPSSIGNDLTVAVVIEETGASATDANLRDRSTHTGNETFTEGAAPSTPAANKVILYAKSDGLLYSKDDAGMETLVSGGSGGGGSYTDEQAQDAVGGILDDGGDIDFTYDDATPKITGAVKNDAVSYAKMQNVSAASKLLGRGDSGSGDPQEISLGSGLSMSGTTLSASGGGGDTALADIYVNDSTGNDSTGTGAIGAPYKTLAKALSVLPYYLEIGHTIHVADGTYAEGIDVRRFRSIGGGNLYITGNTTTPANVTFTGTITSSFESLSTNTACIRVDGGLTLNLDGIRVNATADIGVWITNRANVTMYKMVITGTLSHGIRLHRYCSLEFYGDNTISGFSGNGLAIYYHSHVYFASAGTLTITGTDKTTCQGIHILTSSDFMSFTSATNITITVVKFGFQMAFNSSFTHQGGSSTISIKNTVSAPSNSAAVQLTDLSNWSTNQAVDFDYFTYGWEITSLSYGEQITGSRTVTNATLKTTSLGGVDNI